MLDYFLRPSVRLALMTQPTMSGQCFLPLAACMGRVRFNYFVRLVAS